MSSGPIQTRAANEMIFDFGVTREAAAGTRFVTLSQLNSNITEDRVVDAPGAYPATATMNLGVDWTLIGAAFVGR